MFEKLDPAIAERYLTELRTLLQQHYRHLTHGMPNHAGPLIERCADDEYGFDALVVLLPPHSPLWAAGALTYVEVVATKTFEVLCEPGSSKQVECP